MAGAHPRERPEGLAKHVVRVYIADVCQYVAWLFDDLAKTDQTRTSRLAQRHARALVYAHMQLAAHTHTDAYFLDCLDFHSDTVRLVSI